ncbi:MAG: porphyrin biosynthesis protein [Robiginitomaculum sp.]|nr:MAG: porphyrin biosynthesis protein [Robiginitomaculum sp.]
MREFTEIQKNLTKALTFDGETTFGRAAIIAEAESLGYTYSQGKYAIYNYQKVGHGMYDVTRPNIETEAATAAAAANAVLPIKQITTRIDGDVFIPDIVDEYVQWGNFKDLLTIVTSKVFYPTFITGLSGNGKTMMVEQACAHAKRNFVRMQIHQDTNEDDMLGGFRLVNGETIFAKGPVIRAMEQGAILLLDEVDKGSNRLMALQGVLEGKPVLIKKTGEIVYPAPGFNVISTANTKGKGSDDGRFIATSVIDESFLERYPITMEQEYPSKAIEKKILTNHMKKFGKSDVSFRNVLLDWAQAIRKTFDDGALDEVISTRRLCHIVQTYSIFGDQKKAIDLCISRFDTDTKDAFSSLFDKYIMAARPDEKKFSDGGIGSVEFGSTTSNSPPPF